MYHFVDTCDPLLIRNAFSHAEESLKKREIQRRTGLRNRPLKSKFAKLDTGYCFVFQSGTFELRRYTKELNTADEGYNSVKIRAQTYPNFMDNKQMTSSLSYMKR